MKTMLVVLAGMVFVPKPVQATSAIAVWAVTDRFPVTGTACVGVSAYHENGVSVAFKIDGSDAGTADREEINPATGYPEYFITVHTAGYQDGDHYLEAVATPSSGTALVLDRIVLRIENTSRGRHYYVDGANGRDTNTGLTPAAAWKTIDKANAATRDHDSITVAAGTYTVSERFERDDPGAFRHWVGNSTGGVELHFLSHFYFGAFESVDGFTLSGDGRSLCWYPYAPDNHADHAVIKNCHVVSSGLYGIACYDMQDCAFIDVSLANPSGTFGKSIYINGAHNVRNILRGITVSRNQDTFHGAIQSSLLEDWEGYDLRKTYNEDGWHADFFQWIDTGVSSNLIIRSIKVWYCGSVQFAMPTGTTRDVAYINCRVAADKGPFIFNKGAEDSHICLVHCTIRKQGTLEDGGKTLIGGAGSIIRNCLTHMTCDETAVSENNCYSLGMYCDSDGQNGNFIDNGPHCVKALVDDDEFAAGITADFSLTVGSACIDAGITGDPVRFDALGNIRDDKPDIGAIEYNNEAVDGWLPDDSPGIVNAFSLANPVSREDISRYREKTGATAYDMTGRRVPDTGMQQGIYYLETRGGITRIVVTE